MGNGLVNKIKSLFHKKNNEIKSDEVKVVEQFNKTVQDKEKNDNQNFSNKTNTRSNNSKKNTTHDTKKTQGSYTKRNEFSKEKKEVKERTINSSQKMYRLIIIEIIIKEHTIRRIMKKIMKINQEIIGKILIIQKMIHM